MYKSQVFKNGDITMMSMSNYIKLMVKASKTERHEIIEECLDYFSVTGVHELELEQAEEFCRLKGLI